MDPQQLRAFLAVADTLHFGNAAEQLHLAQPHLSRIIRSLEEDMKAPLFTRTTRRVRLTAAGDALITPARTMLDAEREARTAVTTAHVGRSGRVRICFAGPSAHTMVSRLARAVREEYPLIDLEFRPSRYGATAVGEVIDNLADLAVARFPEPPTGVANRAVDDDECVLAVPVDHAFGTRDSLAIADLRNEPLVCLPTAFGSALHNVLVARCHDAGFAPRIAQTAPDSWTCVALVAAGVGLHFTSRRVVENVSLDGVHMAELDDPLPPLAAYLLWRGEETDPVLDRVLRTSERVLPTVVHGLDAPASAT